jgi:hypothetical protein
MPTQATPIRKHGSCARAYETMVVVWRQVAQVERLKAQANSQGGPNREMLAEIRKQLTNCSKW